MSFVHLHLHSQYSLLDGAIRIDDLMQKVIDYGMPAVALTDHGSMFGALEFYLACRGKGIKPIVGAEVYVAPNSRLSREGSEDAAGHHLVLLCRDAAGYRNLSYLVSAGYKDGFYYKPRIDKELLASHHEGLICLSACLKGEVAWHAVKGNLEAAEKAACWYAELFQGRYYLELQENTIPEQRTANDRLLEIARRNGIPVVATNDCHYLNREDARAHEVLLCIQTGRKLSDPKRMHFSAEEFYVKTPGEMAASFSYAPDAVENTLRIAEECALDLGNFKTYHFPRFDPPDGKTLDQLLEENAREGLESRLREIRRKRPGFSDEDEKVYWDRLRTELDCITQMGFPGYFLIVADFINWAKSRNIPVGPGRGSAAGSLVAYAIRITELDPIPYNLLFERFLNPERISMPDIDVDFCTDRREEVIRYVTEKYGRDKVCQIITFGTMSARSVVRDVGRVLDMSYGEVDRIAKLVPEVLGIKLLEAIRKEPRLRELYDNDPRIRELLDIALRLEGLARNASTHAAGVVVAPDSLEEFCPLYMDQKSGSLTTQFSMKYVEKIGLVKFDFLGLKNLTVIDNAVKLIRSGKDPAFDISLIPDDDRATYDLISDGNTTGVFQLESSGIKEMLRKLKPSCFEDVIAACALYRPGPLGSGMVDDFIERKHGRKEVVYDLPQLEPILKDTYGVIVYQEQVMQIARVLAGYSLGGADILRRAMGKKNPEEMAKQKGIFMEGARNNGIDPRKAEAIFDLMAKFAEYGFNKSHSAAYALVAYQTAYLKTHHPVEFMAALLTEDMSNTDKVVKNISDCRGMGIEVLPPDINLSDSSFLVTEHSIRFGLGAVKGVGSAAVEAILEARSDGPFRDIHDFVSRVDLRRVNKKVVESLIKCGAFDSTGARRSALLAALEEIMRYGQKIQQERESLQCSLFGGVEEMLPRENGTFAIPDIPEWDEKTLLGFEKESLGFYISGHPLNRWISAMKRFTDATVSDLGEGTRQGDVRICGMVVSLKESMTKKGDRMGFATIEDLTGSVEIIAFPEVYAEASLVLKGEEPVVVRGAVDAGEKGVKIIAASIELLASCVARETTLVTLSLDDSLTPPESVETLKRLIDTHRGPCPVVIRVESRGSFSATLKLPESYAVVPTDQFMEDVNRLLGYNAVLFH